MTSLWSSRCFLSLLALLSSSAFAADCDTSEPRAAGDPSGADIKSAITKQNQIATICDSNNWPLESSKLTKTYNHGFMDTQVNRTDANTALKHCPEALNDIISQCISDGQYWGGTWELDGESYRIWNSIYNQVPNNPLMPQDQGGPKSGPSSTPSSSGGATSSAPNSGFSTTPSSSGGATSSAPNVVITAADGPITLGPQTATESGQFATKTSSIPGLTANSVTTTDVDGHHTILPIWWAGTPGLGILVIPAAVVAIPGIVPPPPGFPPIVIGGDGNPTTTGDPSPSDPSPSGSQSQGSSSSSSSSSSASSQSVSIASIVQWVENDGDRNKDPAALKSIGSSILVDLRAVGLVGSMSSKPVSSTTSAPSTTPPPPSTTPPSTTSGLSGPQQECHAKCGNGGGSNRDWCIANCGCFFGAAGC